MKFDLVIAHQPNHKQWGPWFARWYGSHRVISRPQFQTHKPTFNLLLAETRKWCDEIILYPPNRIFMMTGVLNKIDHAAFIGVERIVTPNMIEIHVEDFYDDAIMAVARLAVG
jgi:hypothetical protein